MIDGLPQGKTTVPLPKHYVQDPNEMTHAIASLRRKGYSVMYRAPSNKWLPYDTHAHRTESNIVAMLQPILRCQHCAQYVFTHQEEILTITPWTLRELVDPSYCNRCGVSLFKTTISFSFGDRDSNRFVAGLARRGTVAGELFLRLPLRDLGRQRLINFTHVGTAPWRYFRYGRVVEEDGQKLLVVSCTGDVSRPAINLVDTESAPLYSYVYSYDGQEYPADALPASVRPAIRIQRNYTVGTK